MNRRPVIRGIVLCSGICLLLVTTACRKDMFDNARIKPLERSASAPNYSSARPIPAHTVARGQLDEDELFFTGKIGTNLATVFPMPATAALLERGRDRFNIYCSVCHGRTGEANGMIAQRGFPAPPSLHIERLRQAPPGHFFDVITRGYGAMFSYAGRVEPKDRWAIAAYIRALQLSRDARLEDVPEHDRAALKQ